MTSKTKGNYWCNSTDFMETTYLEYNRWGVSEENCTVLENMPGHYGLKVVVEERGYGKNHKLLTFQTLGINGTSYNIIVVPNIDKISTLPSMSSPNGQLLRIDGKGFSKVTSENTVTVLDKTCLVKDSDFYHITCEMPGF